MSESDESEDSFLRKKISKREFIKIIPKKSSKEDYKSPIKFRKILFDFTPNSKESNKDKDKFKNYSPKELSTNYKEYSEKVKKNKSKEKNSDSKSNESKEDIFIFNPIYMSEEDLNQRYNILQFCDDSNHRLIAKRKNYLAILKQIDCKKRRILLDWIMEVCAYLKFSRQTYHLTVMLIDVFLSNCDFLDITHFQLVGVTCLFISAKNEEISYPQIDTFAESTQFGCKSNQILDMERTILYGLNWYIQFLTLSFWINFIMSRWDEYIKKKDSRHLPHFEKNEKLFNTLFFIIDLISFDYYHIFFDLKTLCSAVLYLVLVKELKFLKLSQISPEYLSSIDKSNEDFSHFNIFISSFLNDELNIHFDELYPSFSYASVFFIQEIYDYITENPKNISQTQDYANLKHKIIEDLEEGVFKKRKEINIFKENKIDKKEDKINKDSNKENEKKTNTPKEEELIIKKEIIPLGYKTPTKEGKEIETI
ncbi:MAG: hypothetical protein MJ252_10040 [archaeon]|nr:hypothetical protein [archaeon]